MEPATTVALLWVFFGVTHVGFAVGPVRDRLVGRLGDFGFMLFFSAVAAASFTLLVHGYSVARWEGARGLALAEVPELRALLLVVAVVGVILASSGLLSYARSPMALLTERVREPLGIERITRHSFFAGVALWAGAHALLAGHLTGTVFFAGFALLGVIGARHQDRKLLARYGEPYAAYCRATSAVPLLAIATGRQRLPVGELGRLWVLRISWPVVALWLLHESLFAADGLLLAGATVSGAAGFAIQAWKRRMRSRATASPV